MKLRFGRVLCLSVAFAALSPLLHSCSPAPVVRVWKDVGGGAHRNFDPQSHFSDLTNDYYDADSGGGSMGGSISAIANFSDQYIMFGTRPDGWAGHGDTICVAPQTLVPDLTNVTCAHHYCPTDDIPYLFEGPEIPILAACDQFPLPLRVEDHCNFNDQIWSYMGTASSKECAFWDGLGIDQNTYYLDRAWAGTVDLTKM
jgi:hypothetical protein